MAQQPNEADLFFEAMQDVTPLKHADTVVLSTNQGPSLAQSLKKEALEKIERTDKNYLSIEKVTPLDPYDFITLKRSGVQEGVFKKLRLGKYDIEDKIQLTRMPVPKARDVLFENIHKNHQLGCRAILVHHGLGLNSKPFPALMKSYVAQWLPQIPEVIAAHTALKQHGGSSAVYVLLKKNQAEKLKNREQQRKR